MWSRKSYPLRVIFFELLPQGERRQRLNIGGKVHICLWSITLPWNALEVENHFWSFEECEDLSKLFGSNCPLYLQPTGPLGWGTGSSAGMHEKHRMLSITGMLSAGSCAIGSARGELSLETSPSSCPFWRWLPALSRAQEHSLPTQERVFQGTGGCSH